MEQMSVGADVLVLIGSLDPGDGGVSKRSMYPE